MDIQEALAGINTFNAMTVTPSQGILGLNLYLRDKTKDKEITRSLGICKEFISVFKNSVKAPSQAMKKDIGVYSGALSVFNKTEERREWAEKLATVEDTISKILEKQKEIDPKSIEMSIQILRNLINRSERTLSKIDYERVISGAVMRIT